MFRRALVLVLLILVSCRVERSLEPFSGRVVKIVDGDTLVVLSPELRQVKVRILAIDAPEKAQAFGTRSRANLAALAFAREVRVEPASYDRYGRIVAKVTAGERDVGLEQVRAGMAWHYKQYARQQSPVDSVLYAGEEVKARIEQKGLWSDAHPREPWKWRKR